MPIASSRSSMAFFKNLFNGFVPAIAWWLLVLLLMCTPGKELPQLGSWTDLIRLDKIIHISVFGLMAWLFMKPFSHRESPVFLKRQIFIKIAIATALWGLTTEFIQQFWIPGRSFDPFDVVADAVGASLAFFAYNRKSA